VRVTPTEHRAALDAQGFTLVAGCVPPAFLDEVRARVERLYTEEGAAAGHEFRREPGAPRLANLVNKGAVFVRLFDFEEILALVAHVLGPAWKLGSLNARDAEPGQGAQPLHCDMGALPDDRGPWVANTMWLLDDFTIGNGATRVVPGSHRAGRLPADALADPSAPHPDERLVTGRAGDVLVMNAHLWHGGTANRTAGPRRALHGFFVRRDRPQQQLQSALLDPALQARLSPRQRWLLALDDPDNARLTQESHVRSGFLK
jgi:hypothetical protein